MPCRQQYRSIHERYRPHITSALHLKRLELLSLIFQLKVNERKLFCLETSRQFYKFRMRIACNKSFFEMRSCFLRPCHTVQFFCNLQCNGLNCKLQGELHRVTSLACNLQCNKKLHSKLREKLNWLLLFAMLRDKLQRLKPLLATCLAIFTKLANQKAG